MVSKVGPQNFSVFVFQIRGHFLAPKIRPEKLNENWSNFGTVGARVDGFFARMRLARAFEVLAMLCQ